MAQKWEYGAVRANRNGKGVWMVNASDGNVPTIGGEVGLDVLMAYMNLAGELGWELTGTVGDFDRVVLFFKRPK